MGAHTPGSSGRAIDGTPGRLVELAAGAPKRGRVSREPIPGRAVTTHY